MSKWIQCCIALLAIALSGCATYQMGRPAPALPPSIHIAPVVNRADAPQIRALLTDALREEFLRAGGWQVQSAERARVTIEVTLIEFRRDAAASSSRDTGRAVSFENRLVAEVTAIDSATGEVLLAPARVEAHGIALTEPSLPDSDYQALPALATQLARRIQDRLASSRW